MKFLDFDYYTCDARTNLMAEIKEFRNIEITDIKTAYTFSTRKPRITPSQFMEELAPFWTVEQVPLLTSENDRFIMTQIHAMTLATFSRYLVAEAMVDILRRYWDSVPYEDARDFCMHMVSTRRIDMTYERLKHSNVNEVAYQICSEYSRPLIHARQSLNDLDASVLSRVLAVSGSNIRTNRSINSFDTMSFVEALENTRRNLRRRVLLNSKGSF